MRNCGIDDRRYLKRSWFKYIYETHCLVVGYWSRMSSIISRSRNPSNSDSRLLSKTRIVTHLNMFSWGVFVYRIRRSPVTGLCYAATAAHLWLFVVIVEDGRVWGRIVKRSNLLPVWHSLQLLLAGVFEGVSVGLLNTLETFPEGVVS